MRLKRLILQGYKTFATKTEFHFDDGITAIVGPNGSGKSNIADAVRWVLGEQSYSTLRGRKTIDMIFTGSQKRPRAGMAQVMLTLDNSNNWLPIDYSEVEIGRRAYRSGENEYILNGQKVRLMDITNLLATSGLAERTYTMIGQGLIDQALSLRADERRALFEEAAGISHYKAKRAETLRRLKETQHNLERIHDILSEVKPRLTSLKRQATKARNYEQIAADLRQLLRIWYGHRWEKSKNKLRVARETAFNTEKAWQASRDQLLAQQEQIESARSQINQMQETLTTTQEQRDEVRDQLEAARREVAILQERQKSLQRQLSDIEEDLPGLEKQQAAAQRELDDAVAQLTAAQENLNHSQAELRQFNSTFEAQQGEINRWQKTIQQTTVEQRQTQNKIAQAEGQLSQLQERLREQEAAPTAAGGAEMVQLQAAFDQQTVVFAAAQSKADELREAQQAIHKERRALIEELKTLRHEARQAENEINRQRNQLARLETRREMLDQLRQETAVIPDAVNLIGQLAGLITIPSAHEAALEAALAHRLGTLLLAEEADMWSLFDGDIQTVTAVPLATIKTSASAALLRLNLPTSEGIIGRANDLVQTEASYQPAVDLLLGGILLVTDRETAWRIGGDLPPGAVAVAPDGFMVHNGGVAATRAPAADSVLAREAAWREAQTRIEMQQADLQAAETAIAARQKAIEEKQGQVDAQQREEQRLGRLAGEAAARAAAAGRERDRTQQQQQFLERQQAEQQQAIGRLRTRIEQVAQTINGFQAAAVTLESKLSDAQARLEALPVAEAQQQRQNLRQDIATAQTIVAGRGAVADSRRATLNQVDGQLRRLRERQASLQQGQSELAARDETARVTRLQAELTRLDEKLTPLREQIKQRRRGLSEMERETAVWQKQTHEKETQYTQARIHLGQQENQMEGLQERIKADLGLVALNYDDEQTGPTPLPIGEVVDQLPVVDELPEDIETTIQQYRGQMQRMGAVNPDAPQEYEETLGRHDFMEQQIEDLTKTEAQLRQVISELDDLTSRAFAATVEKVNEVFRITFTQLFGGGAGRLVLTDPDDLTVSGVDIIARLPNRREQGLGLLSGGERSLTAAALIFSLLKVSPTPFCVMDEVDAALDEANITRFRQLLQELSQQTQFVVITHNRGTVQAAQTIYGISMGADSTSQAISIKPEDYVKQVELI